jgi:DEAD/DEAH box helicase domain-containing protein
LLTVDSQHQIDHLNRHKAIGLLSPQFLNALALPESLRAFGEHTHLELEPLTLAVNREWQRLPARELRVHLGGVADDWEPLAWSFRRDLVRFGESGVAVRLLVPRDVLAALQDSQRGELAVLASFAGASLYELPQLAKAGGLPLCVELGDADHAVRWAASDPVTLAPAPAWGSGERGSSYLRTAEQGLKPLPPDTRPVTLDALRPTPTGVVEIRIGEELDGSSVRFGDMAWLLVKAKVPRLAQWFDGEIPLKSVRYTDRYLRSPLALHLLGSLLSALGRCSGGIVDATSVTVETARLDRLTVLDPLVVHHDWRDAADRRLVGTALLKRQPGLFTWIDETEARRLPHARELELEWADGRRVQIRLDQGVGYWRTVGARTLFPFDRDPTRQVEAFRQLRLRIAAMSQEHPTLWYVAVIQ